MNKKRVWLMLAMCFIPLGALAVITLFNIPLNGVVWFVLVALCPLSHLAMMWLMPHTHTDTPAQPPALPSHDHAAH